MQFWTRSEPLPSL
uniref:Uncharacterized protein n=1 Tax=Anguilla anguilla TaxID=7936 RepID=A0A0E9VZ39_ANGAN